MYGAEILAADVTVGSMVINKNNLFGTVIYNADKVLKVHYGSLQKDYTLELDQRLSDVDGMVLLAYVP